jgi:catechol-2,3-dioxygenase
MTMKRTVDAKQKIKPARFAHFVLRVRDLAASKAWYENVLGMEVVHDAGKIVFFTYDDEHHRLALAETPVETERKPGAPGLDHVAYTLSSLGDLLATYRRLKTLDILPVWPINHGLTTSLYYADPDGNRVEFQVENYPSKKELQDYMRSVAFAKNPIGVEFDPEVLLERFESGEDMEALLRL